MYDFQETTGNYKKLSLWKVLGVRLHPRSVQRLPRDSKWFSLGCLIQTLIVKTKKNSFIILYEYIFLLSTTCSIIIIYTQYLLILLTFLCCFHIIDFKVYTTLQGCADLLCPAVLQFSTEDITFPRLRNINKWKGKNSIGLQPRVQV